MNVRFSYVLNIVYRLKNKWVSEYDLKHFNVRFSDLIAACSPHLLRS